MGADALKGNWVPSLVWKVPTATQGQLVREATSVKKVWGEPASLGVLDGWLQARPSQVKTRVCVANEPTAVQADVLMQLMPKSLPCAERVGTASWVQPAPFHESTIGWFPFWPPVPAAMQNEEPTQETDCDLTLVKLLATVVGVQFEPSHEAA